MAPVNKWTEGEVVQLLMAIIATGGGEINANKARVYMKTDKSARSVRQKVQELGLRGEGGSTAASPGRQSTGASGSMQKRRAADSVGADSGERTEEARCKKEKLTLTLKPEDSPAAALGTDGSSWHSSSPEL